MTVRGSGESVEARLRSGLLACWCGGTLRPWGHARRRRVATFAGLAVVRPRRAICRGGCGRPHVLLRAGLLSRRRYAAPVIFAALALRAAGLKVSSVAARLRLPVPGRAGDCWSAPASTASSWLSRFAGRAGALRQMFLAVLPLADPQGRPVAAAGSPAADALAALEAVTAGLRRRFAGLDTVAGHEVAAHLTGGMLLAPSLPPLAGSTTLIAMAAASPSSRPAGPARVAVSPVYGD
ncbi:MAG: hypothetical protein ACLQDY_16370 [Streptosporangiaceae bacterium]